MIQRILSAAALGKSRLDRARLNRRWLNLRARGMQIGRDVNLPASTWIDTSHCFLISIGDHCGFGEECLILAHDAQMDEFLDAARIGRVMIHESCHIGARTIILAGVEIGPRTLVGAGSVVSKSFPPEHGVRGNPRTNLFSRRLSRAPSKAHGHERELRVREVRHSTLTAERRAELVAAVAKSDAYIAGGAPLSFAAPAGRTPDVVAPRAVPEPADQSASPRRILLVEANEDGTTGGSHRASVDLALHLDRRTSRRWLCSMSTTPSNPNSRLEVHVWDDERPRAALPRPRRALPRCEASSRRSLGACSSCGGLGSTSYT